MNAEQQRRRCNVIVATVFCVLLILLSILINTGALWKIGAFIDHATQATPSPTPVSPMPTTPVVVADPYEQHPEVQRLRASIAQSEKHLAAATTLEEKQLHLRVIERLEFKLWLLKDDLKKIDERTGQRP